MPTKELNGTELLATLDAVVAELAETGNDDALAVLQAFVDGQEALLAS